MQEWFTCRYREREANRSRQRENCEKPGTRTALALIPAAMRFPALGRSEAGGAGLGLPTSTVRCSWRWGCPCSPLRGGLPVLLFAACPETRRVFLV